MRSSTAPRGSARSLKGMSAAASRYYRAELGRLDSSTRKRFEAWARSQRHGHALANDENGSVLLYAERDEERPAKGHMVALRTILTLNWKIPIQLQPGFLRLLSEEDFRAAIAELLSQSPAAVPTAIESPSVRPPPPTSCNMEQVLSLSTDFDDRARAMLAPRDAA